MTTDDAPRVTVLMATHNSADFCEGQLASLAAQTHQNWRLLVSDDQSSDATLAMLETFRAHVGESRVAILTGPGRGATANFLSLLEMTGPEDGLIAFCDHDDIWMPEKLARAIARIGRTTGPTLYSCRVEITDATLRRLRLSALPTRPLGFSHALAENTLTGNSMVLNPAAAALLRSALPLGADPGGLGATYHDWWAYQVIAGAGGAVLFDPAVGLSYRQHGANLIGSGQADGRFLARVRRALGGDYAASLRLQATALLNCKALDAPARARVSALLSLSDLSMWQRAGAIRKIGIYRQRWHEDLVLKVLLLLGRV